ncbi:MAG: Si-specific NAD(P)(+) transhydrogenase [Deltaproteobacteria bacterium]|nr:Si-specific NAD(P)(+) transhydrogenase [Deltaproteobacteria bacterium]
MQPRKKYDVIVIGSGPGGEGAAMQAAKLGLRVVIIEKAELVGGNCTHLGTIPSKTIRHMASQLVAFKSDPLFASLTASINISFSEILDRSRDVISKQVLLRSSHYSRNKVELIHGRASIEDAHSVNIDKGFGLSESLTAENIVLATGSRPFHPEDIDFSHPRVFDSDTILDLSVDPRTITVYGAGVIGCEYTSIFRTLGKKVTLINSRSKLLSFLDDEIVDALSYHLRDQGVVIRHNEFYDSIDLLDDKVVMSLKSGKRVKSDILLVATGRIGNSENLGLEKLGIETNRRGYILVNEKYQTNVPNIYAVGDLTGFPSLASAAYDQGRFASIKIHDPDSDDALIKDIPLGIYTTPEISCVGKTEQELTAEHIPYEVGVAAFRHLARAQITGRTVGMLKLLFHRETLELLGIHCFGQSASEILHIGQTVMAQKGAANSLKYFTQTTFNYPTMAEAYRVAALNGLNRVC